MTALIKGTKEYRKANIKDMQSWPLDKKIEHAKMRIVEFYEAMNGKVCVSFSGGKDSTVLPDLVRSLYPDTLAIFANTTNEFPEILKFVKKTPNVKWVHPKKTFTEIMKETGFPLVSKDVSQAIWRLRHRTEKNQNICNLYLTGYTRAGHYSKRYKLPKKWHPLFDKDETKFEITNKCCEILKHAPAEKLQKELGLHPYIGTMADNSRKRSENWLKFGCNIYNDSKQPKSRPLSIWTEQDVWDYIHKYNVLYCEIYDDKLLEDGTVIQGEKCTGCAYCGFGAHLEKSSLTEQNRFQRLKLRRPKQFKKMMNLTNNGVRFEDALHKVGVAT